MKLSRRSRSVAAIIALVGMLFMQLAVAAYVCPGLSIDQDSQTMAESAADMPNQDMSGCTDMDKSQPNLCHAYVQVGNQSLDKPQVPPVQPFFAVGLALPVSPIDIAHRPAASPPEVPLLERATSPPLAIRNCCFRI